MTVGSIANSNPEHCDLVLQAGIVKPLLRILKHSTTASSLRVASWAYAKCCRGKPAEFATTKSGLKILTQLLLNIDNEVVCNSCWALFHLLESCKEGVNAVINMGFVKRLLKLLPKSSREVQEPALKSLYLITTAGDSCIKAITLRNGITCIKKRLSSSSESIQKLACCTISNIIAGNNDRLQSAIDSNVVPCLIQILAGEQNKKHALWAIYQATEGGTSAQVKYIVTQDCVHHLCDMLVTDCNTAIIALWTLNNVR